MRYISLFLVSMNCLLMAEQFAPVQSPEEIQRAINFLTSTQEEAGAGYLATTGKLRGKFLPLSYYSTKDFWGKYICDELQNDCHVTDRYNGSDYTVSPTATSPGRDLQYERVNVWNGADIYDTATWQIAVALGAKNGLTGKAKQPLADLVENQNMLLSYGYNGNQSGTFVEGANRATTHADGLFMYQQTKITAPENAYFFRMVSRNWLSTDPFQNSAYADLIQAMGLPSNPDYQKGKITWADWKPITGENAWAFLIGPLQSDYIKHVLIDSHEFVPFAFASVQNAIALVPAFQAMQSHKGAVYYAARGSLGNVGDAPVNQYEVSVENNASLLAGLLILQDILQLSLDHEKTLGDSQKSQIKKTLYAIDTMLNGNQSKMGLLAFFKQHAWDAKQGIFVQGGQVDTDWVPTYGPKAVDVQTWTMSVLGQKMIDEWFGFGSAYNCWQSTKKWGGYFGPDDELWGVGYSDLDANQMFSAEWTAGAINCLRSLIVQYEQTSGAEYVESLKKDERSMVAHLQMLSTDHYATAKEFEAARPKDYSGLLSLPADSLAFLYAQKRYMIPFGWYANPLPSTCSTSWAIFLHYNYNPFQLGGGY